MTTETFTDRSPWLTRRQAAERLQVSIDTIDRAIAHGRLTPHRIDTGGTRRHTVRLRVEDVDGLPTRA